MNVWVNSNGLRNRDFRPYISQEELARSVYPYSPNGSGFHYGLYDQAQPSCGTWGELFNQYPSHIPSAVVDRSGRTHMIRPNYWRHGVKYEDLRDHLSNTHEGPRK